MLNVASAYRLVAAVAPQHLPARSNKLRRVRAAEQMPARWWPRLHCVSALKLTPAEFHGAERALLQLADACVFQHLSSAHWLLPVVESASMLFEIKKSRQGSPHRSSLAVALASAAMAELTPSPLAQSPL